MKCSLIAAMARGRVIGLRGSMPWHLPAELQHFKSLTVGKPVIMGRRTYESIGRPLPERRNIVVSGNPAFQATGIERAESLEAALTLAGDAGSPEAMIAGGAQLYAQALSLAGRMYLTYLDLTVDGDTHFPRWDPAEWEELGREVRSADARNPCTMTFVVLERAAG